MNALGLMNFLSRELMRLTGATRCICIRTYDVVRDQQVMRWFGGGKTVGLRLPATVDEKAAEQCVQDAFREWSALEAGSDDDAEYERLRREASAAGMSWMDERST